MNLADLHAAATLILDQSPDPVVRYRLLRDVLRRPATDSELKAARQALNASRHVQLLQSEQHPDGGWGRFHSSDSSSPQKIGRTETAVYRALALGLDASDPILARTAAYLRNILTGRIPFPDPPERNDRWPTGVQLFTAAVLARLHPDDPLIEPPRATWAAIIERTFARGSCDPDAERAAHRELTGIQTDPHYLRMVNIHHMALLGSSPDILPDATLNALFTWLWRNHIPIGYAEVPLTLPPPAPITFSFDAHELLSAFPLWRRYAADLMHCLWQRRNPDGLWDIGKRSTFSDRFPLSESWRGKNKRQHDWSTRLLILLRRFLDPK